MPDTSALVRDGLDERMSRPTTMFFIMGDVSPAEWASASRNFEQP